MKVYLDVCCLSRPFDDQQQDRVRLESEAVLRILTHIELQNWQWVSSEIVDLEIAQSINQERKSLIQALVRFASHYVRAEEPQRERAQELVGLGLQLFDALHIACAEAETVDVFLTTDDRLLRVAQRSAQQLRVAVANPLTWLAGVSMP